MGISISRLEGSPVPCEAGGSADGVSSESGGSGGRFESVDNAGPFQSYGWPPPKPRQKSGFPTGAFRVLFGMPQYSYFRPGRQPPFPENVRRRTLWHNHLRRDFRRPEHGAGKVGLAPRRTLIPHREKRHRHGACPPFSAARRAPSLAGELVRRVFAADLQAKRGEQVRRLNKRAAGNFPPVVRNAT